MKAIIFLITLVLGFECFGQVTQKEVIYGTVRTDGYQKITKGAFWSSRPEARLIYEGGFPTGYNVFVLESDYFVRFENGEHNQFDRNYIVFPEGEKVYTDRNGQFYSAICGNKIEYIRPVNLVNLVEFKTDNVVEQQQQLKQEDWSYQAPNNTYEPVFEDKVVDIHLQKSYHTKKREIKIGAIVIPIGIGAIVAGTATYFLSRKSSSKSIDGSRVTNDAHGDNNDTGGRVTNTSTGEGGRVTNGGH